MVLQPFSIYIWLQSLILRCCRARGAGPYLELKPEAGYPQQYSLPRMLAAASAVDGTDGNIRPPAQMA
ncbi:hypothetical protein NtRootA9_37960 [Arthrobacter sp. NtRootA9]|nr:hypothetical protein NtRootA9_37960 [Arthrobacter sp. NtRootA9]